MLWRRVKQDEEEVGMRRLERAVLSRRGCMCKRPGTGMKRFVRSSALL